MCGPGDEILELTGDQKKELEGLTKELSDLASDVIEDYNQNPSENSGSMIHIHNNSPSLNEE